MSNTTTSNTTTEAQDIDSLTSALIGFATDQDVTALQSAYRAVHASRRGKVQSASLRAAELDAETMMAALEAFTDLPAATSSRTNSRTVTDEEQDTIRRAFLDHIVSGVDVAAYGIGDDEFLLDIVETVAEKVRRYVTNLSIGNSRTVHSVDPVDVTGGPCELKANYKDQEIAADLLADNTVQFGQDIYPSVSAAAKAVVGRAQNGWSFWRHNGQTLASLRDS